jgi:hypothetical protein
MKDEEGVNSEAIKPGRGVLPFAGGEVRLNDDDSIDEICVNDVDIHLEQMTDGLWWMGITPRSDRDNRLMVNLFASGRAHIKCNAESEDGRLIAGFGKT